VKKFLHLFLSFESDKKPHIFFSIKGGKEKGFLRFPTARSKFLPFWKALWAIGNTGHEKKILILLAWKQFLLSGIRKNF